MAFTSYSSPDDNYIMVLVCHCEKLWTKYGVLHICRVMRALDQIQIHPLVNMIDYVCATYGVHT